MAAFSSIENLFKIAGYKGTFTEANYVATLSEGNAGANTVSVGEDVILPEDSMTWVVTLGNNSLLAVTNPKATASIVSGTNLGNSTGIDLSGAAKGFTVSGADKFSGIIGGKGNDSLVAGAAGAVLYGGKGDNTLVGNVDGKDAFVVSGDDKNSKNVITNYDSKNDSIYVYGYDFADLKLGTDGSFTVGGSNTVSVGGVEGKQIKIVDTNNISYIVNVADGEGQSTISSVKGNNVYTGALDGDNKAIGKLVLADADVKKAQIIDLNDANVYRNISVVDLNKSKVANKLTGKDELATTLIGGTAADVLTAGKNVKAEAGTASLVGGDGKDTFVINNTAGIIVKDYIDKDDKVVLSTAFNESDWKENGIATNDDDAVFTFAGGATTLTGAADKIISLVDGNNVQYNIIAAKKSAEITYDKKITDIYGDATKNAALTTSLTGVYYLDAAQGFAMDPTTTRMYNVNKVDATNAKASVLLFGNEKANTLIGGAATDVLYAGNSADNTDVVNVLEGGKGADLFLVDDKSTTTINDYKAKDKDVIQLFANSVGEVAFANEGANVTMTINNVKTTLKDAAGAIIGVVDKDGNAGAIKVASETDDLTYEDGVVAYFGNAAKNTLNLKSSDKVSVLSLAPVLGMGPILNGIDNVAADGVTTNMVVFGNDNDNTIVTGKGNDVLASNGGNNTLTGGAGKDLFGIYENASTTTITDASELDTVLFFNADLTTATCSASADLSIVLTNGNTVNLASATKAQKATFMSYDTANATYTTYTYDATTEKFVVKA